MNQYAFRAGVTLLLSFASIGAMGQGCSPTQVDTVATDPRLEIGVTDNGVYRPISDGDEIGVVRGSQGAYMTLVSFRLSGFPSVRDLRLTSHAVMRDNGDVVVPELTLPTLFQTLASDTFELVDYRLLLSGTQDGLRGRQATLTFTVSDANDENIAASASVVVTFVDGLP